MIDVRVRLLRCLCAEISAVQGENRRKVAVQALLS